MKVSRSHQTMCRTLREHVSSVSRTSKGALCHESSSWSDGEYRSMLVCLRGSMKTVKSIQHTKELLAALWSSIMPAESMTMNPLCKGFHGFGDLSPNASHDPICLS